MRLFSIKNIRILKVEEREKDAWLDISLRTLREGKVRFYKVQDTATGEWLFKVCPDTEEGRIIIKALKCPPGKEFAQLEGSTMLFQKSILDGFYYDVVSLSYIDEGGRLRRKLLDNIEDIPKVLRENFEMKTYEDATGREAPWKRLVTLCRESDEKSMIILFLIERAWTISPVPLEIRARMLDLLSLIRNLERAEVSEVYRRAKELYDLDEKDVDVLLSALRDDGKIEQIEGGFIKTRR